MSNKQIDDGGPAFPVPTSVELNENSNRRGLGDIESCGGMSLRDWFFGKALEGMLANPELPAAFTAGEAPKLKNMVVRAAWDYADIAIAERLKTP